MTEHTPTPWAYRPNKHDDWGWIRAPVPEGDSIGPLVAMARSGSWENIEMLDRHRTARADPYGANAAFIVKAVNNHDALVFALTELYQSFEFCVGKNTPVAVEARRVLDAVSSPVNRESASE